MEKIDDVSRERVETLRKDISDALNRLSGSIEAFRWACEKNVWNDDVASLIEEGCLKLGFALASLNTWFDDVEEEDCLKLGFALASLNTWFDDVEEDKCQ